MSIALKLEKRTEGNDIFIGDEVLYWMLWWGKIYPVLWASSGVLTKIAGTDKHDNHVIILDFIFKSSMFC